MTNENDPKNKKKSKLDKASLGGETVEPRILLSASWIYGTMGNDVINGTSGADNINGLLGSDVINAGDGDDMIMGHSGNDTIRGGAGYDTVNYGFTGPVTVDLTRTDAQNTGGAGTDTLTGIEGVIGSMSTDTFAFSAPVAGANYTVNGNFGSDVINLSGYSANKVTFSDGHLQIDLGSGQSFGIDYSGVESIQFGDTPATILTGNLTAPAFTGSGIYVDNGHAFRMDVAGGGSIDWSYDAGSDRVSISDTTGTSTATSVTITDLNGNAQGGNDLQIGTISVDRDLGSLTSNVDIGTLNITGNYNTITTISIDGGAGSLGTFHAAGKIDAAMTIAADVGTVTLDAPLQGTVTVTGDVGTWNMGQVDVSGGIHVQGNAGSIAMGDMLGTFQVDGNVGSLSTAYVQTSMTISGDLNRGTFTVVDAGATITIDNAVGVLDFQVGGVQKGGTFATPVQFIYDGATGIATTSVTGAPTADAGVDQIVNEGNLVTLTGLASFDPTADALTYTWVQVSGPTVVLSDPTAAQPTFTAPDLVGTTDLKFQLIVNDGVQISRLDTVIITVNADNDAPTGNAGLDQVAFAGAVITLDATGSSDPEAQALTHTWTQTAGPMVTLSDANAAQPTFTSPSVSSPTVLTFQVAISDGANSTTDTVTAIVNPPGLVANWTFSGSGQTVADITGHGNDGTLGSNGSAQSSDPARANDAVRGDVLAFDGDDYVTNIGMGPSGDFSLSAWMNHNGSGSGWDTIYSSGDDETWIGIEVSTGKVGLNIGGAANWIETSAGVVNFGTWQHVTGTWDGTTGHIYVDGVDMAVTVTGTPRDPVAGSGVIGAYAADPNTYNWDGKLDDVRVYDSAISGLEAIAASGNLNPNAIAGADQVVNENDVVTLDASASTDPEASGLSYSWVQVSGPTVTLSDATNVRPTFTAPDSLSNTAVSFQLTARDNFGATSLDTVTVTINANNDAPTANAGVDLNVAEGDIVTLNATGSTDPEGQPLGYTWVQTSGPAVVLSDPSAAQPTFTAPEGLTNSTVQFTLTVTDGTNISIDTIAVTINADNDAPTANAGVDQVVAEGATVTLNGDGSTDPEGQALSYAWVQTAGPAVVLSSATAAQPTFTAPEGLTNSTVQFTLTVTDGTNISVDTVAVTINADNDAPTANAGVDQSVNEGDLVALSADGSTDPEGQPLTFAWVQTAGPAVLLSDPTDVQPTFRAPEGLTNSTVRFQLTVSDGTNISVDTIAITINADNDAPAANAGPDQAVSEGDRVTLNGTGSTDPEGTALTYVWVQTSGPLVVLNNPLAAQPAFSAPDGLSNSTVEFALTVSDGINISVDTVAITINADNDAPTARASALGTVAERSLAVLNGLASTDPEGSALTYKWVQTSGPTVTLLNETSAVATFVAPEGLSNSSVSFELTVSDGTSSSVDTATIVINAVNDAPTADAGLDQTVREGGVVVLDASTSIDPEGQALTYTWRQVSGPPVALQPIDAATPMPVQVLGLFQGLDNSRMSFVAPEGLTNTTAVFEVTVTDGTNTSVDTVAVTINANDDAPSANAGPDQSVPANTKVSLLATATDPESQPLTYTWRQISGPQVQISGGDSREPWFTTPTGQGGAVLVFAVEVSDGKSTSVDTVAVTLANSAPTVTAGGSGTVMSGEPVQLSATAQDIDGDNLTYRWTQLSGPSVSLAGGQQNRAVFQAPTVSTTTTFTFQVEVSDGQTTTMRNVTVTVQPPPVVAEDTPPTSVPPTPTVTPPTPTNSPPSQNPISPPTSTGSSPAPTDEPLVQTTFETNSASGQDEAFAEFRSMASVQNQTHLDNAAETSVNEEAAAVAAPSDTTADVAQVVEQTSILVEAGTDVEISPDLMAPAGAQVQYTWTQVSGTEVAVVDGNSTKLRIQLPQSFSAEELVFSVEMQVGDQVVVQLVTLQLQPVDGESKDPAVAKAVEFRKITDLPEDSFEEARGVGKVWASLVAFTSMAPGRSTRK